MHLEHRHPAKCKATTTGSTQCGVQYELEARALHKAACLSERR